MPARRRQRPGIRALKLLLLVVVAGSIAGVVALYWMGRRARVELPRAPTTSVAETGPLQRGEGFDHTVSRDGRPLFRIRGRSDRRDESGNLVVEEVLIRVFAVEGREFQIVAQRAEYNLEAEEARLIGDVSVSGSDGLGLRAEALELRQSGRVVESEGPVQLRYGNGGGGLEGTAGGLRADLQEELFILNQGVALTGRRADGSSFQLTSKRAYFRRDEHIVRASTDVVVLWGDSELRSGQLAAHLDPGDDHLRFFQARIEVEARLRHGEGEGRRATEITGSEIVVLFDEVTGKVTKVESEDDIRGRTHVKSTGVTGTTLTWRARFFQATFLEEVLRTLEALGRVEMVEHITGVPTLELQRLCGNRLTATFGTDGDPQRVELGELVDVHHGPQQLLADLAVLRGTDLEVTGDPVRALSRRGRLEAPQMIFQQRTGILTARGGVETILQGGAEHPLTNNPFLGQGGDVRVTSNQAFLRDEPRAFMFQGEVKAWSEDRVLLAEQLRGDAEPPRLSASGGVDTVWYLEPAGDAGATQTRVTAETLVYDQRLSNIEYSDDVVVAQTERTLRCQTLVVALDAEGQAESLSCRGEVVLEEGENGRTVRSDAAEYDLASQVVVFTGSPVELEEAQGGKLQGRRLRYSTRDQTARMSNEASPPLAPTPSSPETP